MQQQALLSSPKLLVAGMHLQVFHQLDHLLPPSPIPLDDLLAVILLLYFGLTTLKVRRGAVHSLCRGYVRDRA